MVVVDRSTQLICGLGRTHWLDWHRSTNDPQSGVGEAEYDQPCDYPFCGRNYPIQHLLDDTSVWRLQAQRDNVQEVSNKHSANFEPAGSTRWTYEAN